MEHLYKKNKEVVGFLTSVILFVAGCTGDPKVFRPLHQVQFDSNDQQIAQAYAPVIYHELGSHPRFDKLTKFDFDGDFVGINNWENSETLPLPSYVYYSVVESSMYYFIFYGVYHPRDYEKHCFWVTCHENDFEGAMVTVDKRTLKVAYVETQAHDHFFLYRPNFATDPNGDSRVALYIEKEGHGVFLMDGQNYIVRQACEKKMILTPTGTQIQFPDIKLTPHRIYWPKRVPEESGDREIGTFGYALVPMSDIWNKIGQPDFQSMFQFAIPFAKGDLKIDLLPRNFYGDNFSLGKIGPAKPPWAWTENKCRQLQRGDWYLDPQKSLDIHLGNPTTESRYIFNPYLQIYRDARQ